MRCLTLRVQWQSVKVSSGICMRKQAKLLLLWCQSLCSLLCWAAEALSFKHCLLLFWCLFIRCLLRLVHATLLTHSNAETALFSQFAKQSVWMSSPRWSHNHGFQDVQFGRIWDIPIPPFWKNSSCFFPRSSSSSVSACSWAAFLSGLRWAMVAGLSSP